MPEGTGSTLYQGVELEPPTGFGHLPEVVYTRLEFGKKFAVPQTSTSMLADTIVHVEKAFLQGLERPSEQQHG